MSVPGLSKYLLPLLKLINDGKEYHINKLYEPIADYLNLSKEDRDELLPSGKQRRHINRVLWASTILKKAMLIEPKGRGIIIISKRGQDVLSQRLDNIDIKYLERFPEFVEFHRTTKTDKPQDQINKIEDEQTPEEIFEASYNSLMQDLAKEILVNVKSCSPKFFENLVVDLLVAMGYGGSRKDAGQAVGQSGDGGIDGIIKEDKLGLDVVYIQAKRWENTVGRPEVQKFAGSLMGKRANKGVMIATSKFSQDARDYVKNIDKKIVLIDGDELAQFMIQHDIGVYEISNYVIKKINTDYFEELI